MVIRFCQHFGNNPTIAGLFIHCRAQRNAIVSGVDQIETIPSNVRYRIQVSGFVVPNMNTSKTDEDAMVS